MYSRLPHESSALLTSAGHPAGCGVSRKPQAPQAPSPIVGLEQLDAWTAGSTPDGAAAVRKDAIGPAPPPASRAHRKSGTSAPQHQCMQRLAMRANGRRRARRCHRERLLNLACLRHFLDKKGVKKTLLRRTGACSLTRRGKLSMSDDSSPSLRDRPIAPRTNEPDGPEALGGPSGPSLVIPVPDMAAPRLAGPGHGDQLEIMLWVVISEAPGVKPTAVQLELF